VGLREDLDEIASAARSLAAPSEVVSGVIATEPEDGVRVYLCAFEGAEGRTWLALDRDGAPVGSRRLVRDAVAIAGLCELAEERAGGGDPTALRARLAALRGAERPGDLVEVEAAADKLVSSIRLHPRVASPEYLDLLGIVTKRLEDVLGETGRSPFAEAMNEAAAAIEELTRDVEMNYRFELA
jgi:hypothetical protein